MREGRRKERSERKEEDGEKANNVEKKHHNDLEGKFGGILTA